MKGWTKEDWLRWQRKVIREEARETIEKESDRRAPVVKKDLMRIMKAS